MLMLVACVAVQFAVFWATGRTPRHVSNVVIKGKY
jgi:hypothetical protein